MRAPKALCLFAWGSTPKPPSARWRGRVLERQMHEVPEGAAAALGGELRSNSVSEP